MKPYIFLKQTPSNIKTNAFSIQYIPLWFANMDIQFILDYMQLHHTRHHNY
jgi:hypothetical protein